MTYQVTKEQKQRYREEGYIIIPDVLSQSEIEQLVERVDGLLSGRYTAEDCIAGVASQRAVNDPGRLIKQVMPTKYPITDAVLRSWSEHPVLKSIACQLMEADDARVFQQQALVKDAGEDNGTPWHQDDFYWQSGGRAITAWIPLESLFIECGTMFIVPRTHQGEILPHYPAGGVSAFHGISVPVDEITAVPLLMDVGSVSFHHSMTIHGAYGNRGDRRRIAMAQHYLAETS